jgi:hypothetical protein
VAVSVGPDAARTRMTHRVLLSRGVEDKLRAHASSTCQVAAAASASEPQKSPAAPRAGVGRPGCRRSRARVRGNRSVNACFSKKLTCVKKKL